MSAANYPLPFLDGLCEVMHEAYEDAAIAAGWETQERSRVPWPDVPRANKQTMRAAVTALLRAVGPALQERAFDECETARWDPDKTKTFGDETAHLHEEVSEAFRAWRQHRDFEVRFAADGKPEGVPVEFADTFIGMLYCCHVCAKAYEDRWEIGERGVDHPALCHTDGCEERTATRNAATGLTPRRTRA